MQAKYQYVTVEFHQLDEFGAQGFKAVCFQPPNGGVVMERVITQTGQLLSYITDLEKVKAAVEELRSASDGLPEQIAALRKETDALTVRLNSQAEELICMRERVNYLKNLMEADEDFDWDAWIRIEPAATQE